MNFTIRKDIACLSWKIGQILECNHVFGHAKVMDCAKVLGKVLGEGELCGNSCVIEDEYFHLNMRNELINATSVQYQAPCLEDETTLFCSL